jgi:hypothetical protein
MGEEIKAGLTDAQKEELAEKRYDRDVGLTNIYRLECIKHCMTLATGTLVFTVTFKKDYLSHGPGSIVGNTFASAGWVFLVLSLASGIWHMQCWEHFYSAWISDHSGDTAKRKRLTKIWLPRARVARMFQYCSLAFGQLGIASYVILDLWK